MLSRHFLFFVLCGIVLIASGCSQDKQARRVDPSDRDPAAATRLVEQGIKHLQQDDLEQARIAFESATERDVFSGIAHNNLGHVYFAQGNFYAAARQFQHASRLMPYQPEPTNNLGLVFETVGKYNDSIAYYEQAVHQRPGDPRLLGNLCRARIRRGDRDEQTRLLLADLVLHETRLPWRVWAQKQLRLLGS